MDRTQGETAAACPSPYYVTYASVQVFNKVQDTEAWVGKMDDLKTTNKIYFEILFEDGKRVERGKGFMSCEKQFVSFYGCINFIHYTILLRDIIFSISYI